MKAIIRYYDEDQLPEHWRYFTSLPVLDLSIHGAPHNRQHRSVLQKYREELYSIAKMKLAVALPIEWPIFVKVLFVNPNSPDTDHLYMAMCQALDAKTLKGPSILADDRWIQGALVNIFYPHPPTKRDGQR